QNVFRAAMNNGVAGVVPALAADHDVRLGRQHVDDLALAFVAPLRADQNCVRHENKTTNCPDASVWTHSGLRKRIGWPPAAARKFAGGSPQRSPAFDRPKKSPRARPRA